MNTDNNNITEAQSSSITASRRKGSTVKTVSSEQKPDNTETPIIGVRRHAKPEAAKSVTADSAKPVAKEDAVKGVVILRRPAKKAADAPSRKIDIGAAVDNAGSAMLNAPSSLPKTAKSVFGGMKSFFKTAPSAVAAYIKKIPSLVKGFFTRHSFVKWVRTRTVGQWLKLAGATLGIILVIAVAAVFIFADSMLDKINYVSADQYGYISQSEADLESISITDLSPTDITSESDMELEALTLTLDKFTEDMFDIDPKDVTNILLLGTDTRSGKYVRDNSDTMMLLSIDTKRNTIKLTSFMRDSYVTIPGYKGKYRLNAAFAFGGAELLFKTLDYNFDIKVDKFVRVNFNAFVKAVNIVGGIEMDVTSAEAKYMCSHKVYGYFPRYSAGAGTYVMTGSEALNYARCRKVDSDFGRTNRQRKVIIAIADKLKGSKISTMYDLMNELLPLVETNLSKSEIYGLVTPALASITKEIETLNVPVKGSWKDYNANGASVLSLDFKINKKAVRAHIYSTTKLDIEEKVWQSSFQESGSGNTTTTTTKTTTTTTESTSATESTSSTESTSKTTSTKPTSSTSSTTSSTSSTTSSTSATESTTKSTTESTTKSTESTTTTEATTTTTKTTTTTTKATTTTAAPLAADDGGEA